MMKKFCMIGVSIGEDYQSFIPHYIFSILKSYPEYSVLVFSDVPLAENTKKMLELIRDVGQFEVIDNYRFGLNADQHLLNRRASRQAIRFLFYDERFDEFETLYFGDIDIFVCREQGGIYEQHLDHCKLLNLPYSNYVRAVASMQRSDLRTKISLLVNGKFKHFKSSLKPNIHLENRLTGLHFVKTQEYFEKVRPLFPYYIDVITGRKQRSDLRRDEEILYELVKNSGLGLPPISPNSADLDNNQSQSIAFCPLHGIHLGIFRDKYTPIIARQVLQSYVYQDYYHQFKTLDKYDPRLRELIKLSNPFVQQQILEMENYYEFSETQYYKPSLIN